MTCIQYPIDLLNQIHKFGLRSPATEMVDVRFRCGGHHVDTRVEKRKAALRRPSHNALISLRKFGAGEGIRTLDPNLGKVWDGATSVNAPISNHGKSPINQPTSD